VATTRAKGEDDGATMTEIHSMLWKEIIKPIKIGLKGEGTQERAIQGVKLIKVHYIHIQKYHRESSSCN
jgi:hypothetical protein